MDPGSALRRGVCLAVPLGWLAGCGTSPAVKPAPPASPAGAAVPAAPVSPSAPAEGSARPGRLEVERHWLQSWFQGTPVLIARHGASLRVDVPLVHAFEPGQPQVKPALGAVLDKLAESLRRNPHARLRLVAAPGDGAGGGAGGGPAELALATKRATQVRAHLRQRGVAEARLASPSRTTVAAVQLRVEEDPV